MIGCWLNAPLNKWLGRRGTIFISCSIAIATAFWQAASPNWMIFLAGRLVLGLCVGAKSSTTPIYAAECSPPGIRGALTMMWQMWTAFGIMLGNAVSLAFQNADFLGENSQWRWMIGITALPPILVCCLVYTLPESPRWYMDKGKYPQAFESMRKLRKHDIQAARDMYLVHKSLEIEKQVTSGKCMLRELFSGRRRQRALMASWFCMVMQQFCAGQ